MPEYGALVVIYDKSYAVGYTSTLAAMEDDSRRYFASVSTFVNDEGKELRAALFPAVPPGNYHVYKPDRTSTLTGKRPVTVFPGSIAETEYT